MSWSSSGRRARLASLLVVVGALVASVVTGVVAPTPARADGGIFFPPPTTGIAPTDVSLVQGLGVAPAYEPSPDQFDALRNLEATAVDTVLRRHGIEPNDTDRVRMRLWNRTELRLELLSEIVLASTRPAASRTADEQSALAWFAEVQQRRNIQVAQAAKAEYEKFAGNTAYQGGVVPQNNCTYVPPAPFAAEYPGAGMRRWTPCYGGRPGALDLGPRTPSADEFTRWGNAAVAGREFTTEGVALGSLLGSAGVGLLAVSALAGSTVAAVAALPTATAAALFQAMGPLVVNAFSTFPAAYTAAVPAAVTAYEGVAAVATASTGASSATVGSASTGVASTVGYGAGAVFGVAAVVIIALTAAITAILQVTDAANVGQKLLDMLAKAQSTPVDPVAALAVPGGLNLLTQAVQGVTLSPDLANVAGADAYLPAPGGETLLQVTGAYGAGPGAQRTDRLSFVRPGPNGNEIADMSLAQGWWTDNDPDPATRDAPAQAVDMYLVDPNPVDNGTVRRPRAAFDFPARVTTIEQGGRLRFLVTTPGRSDKPAPGSACADLAIDRCWLTDTLPVLDPFSTYRAVSVSLLPNRAGDFGIIVPTTRVQNQSATFRALREDAPYTTDNQGDAVTLRWSLQCPNPLNCPRGGSGTEQTFTFPSSGTYTLTATATDTFGSSATQQRTFTVAAGPPALTLAATQVSGSSAAPVVVSGRATTAEPRFATVRVEWGDGTAPTTYVLAPDGSFGVPHTYRGVGTYTASVTTIEGGLTSPAQQVTVTIGNSAPTMAFAPDALTPTSWKDLAPGTQISVKGTVTDADADQTLTLTATWYDGTVEQVPVVRNGRDATSSFILRHTVQKTTGLNFLPFDPQLLRVTATDSVGAVSGPALWRGTVDDVAPVFGRITTAGDPADLGVRTLTGTVTDANLTTPGLFVQWGDAAPDRSSPLGEPVAVAADGSFSVTHRYDGRGDFTALLTAGTFTLGGATATTEVTMYVLQELPVLQYARFVTPPVVGQPATLEIGVSSPEDGSVHINWAPVPLGGGYDDIAFPTGDHVLRVTHVYTRETGGRVTTGYVSYGADGGGVGGSFEVPDAVVANPGPPAPTPGLLRAQPGEPVTLPLTYADLGADTNTVTVDWGDGTSTDQSTLSLDQPAQDLTHTYAAAGAYDVALTLRDLAGNTVTASARSIIGTVPPTLGAPVVVAALEGAATTVSATAVDPAGGPTRLRVDWGDGATTTTDPATTADPQSASHVYADNGKYAVTVTALADDDVASAPRTVRATVGNATPAVTATAPTQVAEGAPLDLGLVVADAGTTDGGALQVDFGDGSPVTTLGWTPTARQLTVRHVFADDDPTGTPRDTRWIGIKVRDDDGWRNVKSVKVTVVNVAPTVSATLTDAAGRPLATGAQLPIGGAVVARVRVSDPGATDVLTAAVVWGDGARSVVPVTGGLALVPHRFTQRARPAVSVTVTDDDRGVATAAVGKPWVVSTTTTAAGVATALRARAAADPTGADQLRAAAKTLDRTTGDSVQRALAAGDVTTALRLLQQAVGQVQAALDAGAAGTATTPAMDLALLARSVATTAAATVDPANAGAGDATRAVSDGDDAAVTADVVRAVAAYRQSWLALTPP